VLTGKGHLILPARSSVKLAFYTAGCRLQVPVSPLLKSQILSKQPGSLLDCWPEPTGFASCTTIALTSQDSTLSWSRALFLRAPRWVASHSEPMALLLSKFNFGLLQVVSVVSYTLHHHSSGHSRLDPQLIQGFHFEGAEVGGLAFGAPNSPMHLLSPS
jgi:hypothetical protein